jgi:hypothetical protein
MKPFFRTAIFLFCVTEATAGCGKRPSDHAGQALGGAAADCASKIDAMNAAEENVRTARAALEEVRQGLLHYEQDIRFATPNQLSPSSNEKTVLEDPNPPTEAEVESHPDQFAVAPGTMPDAPSTSVRGAGTQSRSGELEALSDDAIAERVDRNMADDYAHSLQAADRSDYLQAIARARDATTAALAACATSGENVLPSPADRADVDDSLATASTRGLHTLDGPSAPFPGSGLLRMDRTKELFWIRAGSGTEDITDVGIDLEVGIANLNLYQVYIRGTIALGYDLTVQPDPDDTAGTGPLMDDDLHFLRRTKLTCQLMGTVDEWKASRDGIKLIYGGSKGSYWMFHVEGTEEIANGTFDPKMTPYTGKQAIEWCNALASAGKPPPEGLPWGINGGPDANLDSYRSHVREKIHKLAQAAAEAVHVRAKLDGIDCLKNEHCQGWLEQIYPTTPAGAGGIADKVALCGDDNKCVARSTQGGPCPAYDGSLKITNDAREEACAPNLSCNASSYRWWWLFGTRVWSYATATCQ